MLLWECFGLKTVLFEAVSEETLEALLKETPCQVLLKYNKTLFSLTS